MSNATLFKLKSFFDTRSSSRRSIITLLILGRIPGENGIMTEEEMPTNSDGAPKASRHMADRGLGSM